MWKWILIILGILALLVVAFYFIYKKFVAPKMNEYNDMMQANKMTVSIFVIEKKKDKFSNQNVPKAVMDQIPKMLRGKKFPLVKAKIGPQIQTLIADEEVFKKIPVKKMVKVDLAGMYIVGLK